MINRSLKILIIASTTMTFIIGVFMPFYVLFVEQLGGTILLTGSLLAVLHILIGFFLIFFSRWEQHISNLKNVYAYAQLLRGLVFLSYLFVTSLWQLFIIQILWALATSLSLPAFDGMYTHHLSKNGEVMQWGNLQAWSQFAIGVSALLGGFLVQKFGFDSILFCMSLISFYISFRLFTLSKNVL